MLHFLVRKNTRDYRVTGALCMAIVMIFMGGCSVFGGASVEEAPYELVQKEQQFEIRDYAPVIVAQTQVSGDLSSKEAGNRAFRKLFNYISGENASRQEIAMTAPVLAENTASGSRLNTAEGEEIAMTAPVTYQKEGDTWRYRFVLPESYTMETAPQPLDPGVSLKQIDSRRVATVTYAGLGRNKARENNTSALLEWVEAQGFQALSMPRWAGYNPPWTLPPFRRNEVMIDIAVE